LPKSPKLPKIAGIEKQIHHGGAKTRRRSGNWNPCIFICSFVFFSDRKLVLKFRQFFSDPRLPAKIRGASVSLLAMFGNFGDFGNATISLSSPGTSRKTEILL